MLPLISKYVIYGLGMLAVGLWMYKDDKRKGVFFGCFSTSLLIVIDFLFAKFA